MSAPLVSVAVLTFDHARFVAAALDSVLGQEVDFDLEIVVGDDASRDETPQILEDYAARNPELIHLLPAGTRRGVFHNVRRVLQRCRGEFVALLEGDDAWTSRLKLARQVAFLQENDGYAGCFHDASIRSDEASARGPRRVHKSGFRYYSRFNTYPAEFRPASLLDRNVIPTATLVYRNQDLTADLARFADVDLSLSWLLELLIIRYSKFHYFDEVWAVHNNHAGSVTKARPVSDFIQANLRILHQLKSDDCYRDYLPNIYRAQIRELRYLFDELLVAGKPGPQLATIARLAGSSFLYSFHEVREMMRKYRRARRAKTA